MLKALQTWVPQIGFLILGVLAVLYREERLFVDSGYYFFHVVNSEWFHIEHNRLILGLSQFLLLIGVKLGLGMKWLTLIYSVGHIVFFLVVYLFSRFKYDDKSAGYSILLIQVLGVTQGFFVPMFELYYAAGLLVLFNAMLQYRKLNIGEQISMIVLSTFIASAHFMAIALLVVLLTLHLLREPTKNIMLLMGSICSIAIVMAYKKFNVTPYEQGKIDWFLNGLGNFQLSGNYLKNVGDFLFEHYKDYLTLVILVVLSLIISRHWKRLFLYIAATASLTIIVTISDPWFEPSRYQEQVYFPIMFLSTLFFSQVGIEISHRKWASSLFLIVITIITSISIYEIQRQSLWFTNRLADMNRLLEMAQEIDGTKFVIEESELKHDPNWSYPIETLILSSSNFDKTITVCTVTDFNYDTNYEQLDSSNFLFRRWEIEEIKTLNSSYFELDASTYQLLN